ncbi:MAG: methionine adenosyltransferase [Deltaproteobacteria bacterium]|nr:methionine adenosyltransferase [Deltaproteobacteria bacterium]
MSGYLFTSESVTEGHPDKICDKISDSLLDAYIGQDTRSRVALETMVKTGFVVVGGEVTSKATIDIAAIVRDAITGIGYTDSSMGFDAATCGILTAVEQQSPDIAQGVDRIGGKEQGAGDQGLMFGYAVGETRQLMPMPIDLSHKLARRLAQVRKRGVLPWLRPDGKTQVTVEYEDDQPARFDAIVVSTQHAEGVKHRDLKEAIIEEVIKPTLPAKMIDKKTKLHVNPTGRFVVGGPYGDAGLTGRKIIVDTYGGMGRHGGGSFSGKDPSKVDRSAAYFARYVAKNIVASKVASRCEVQVAYAIGVAEPMGIYVTTFGTGRVDDERIAAAVSKMFDFRPRAIVETLDLLRPIYTPTAAYGHFGRTEKTFTWERTDRAEELRSALLPKSSRSRTNGKPTKKKSAAKKRTKSIRPRAAAR